MTATGTRMPFQPKGDHPEWQLIYDPLLSTADYGTLITYAELDDALGRTFKDNRSPIYRAREHLGDTRRRWLEAVPGKGYRVIEAVEHLMVANRHKRKGQRQFGAMVRVADTTDLSRLTPEQLATFDDQRKHIAVLYMISVHNYRQLQRHEDALRKAGLLDG